MSARPQRAGRGPALLLALALTVSAAAAQTGVEVPGAQPPTLAASPPPWQPAPLSVLRLAADERITLDGRLDDPAWQRAEPLAEFYEIDPGERIAPKVRTDARFAYDAGTLYVAIRAWEPDLAALRAPFARRDDLESDADHVTVYIDPTGERRFAQFFDVNPRGSVADGLYNEQTGTEDISPNFRFTAKTGRFEAGWTIELAIPFASLRHGDAPLQRWNVLVTRNHPRDHESYYIVSAPMPRESTCMICFARPLVGLADLPKQTTLALTPTLTARTRREREGDGPERREHHVRGGLDLKARLRADTFLDATIRPDFSQVEIDAPQLASNTRYAIYFPEKRPFFLEGSDILESPLPVLQTRAIAAPDWGLRTTRRGPASDFAVIVARDAAIGEILLPNTGYTTTELRRGASTATLARGRLHLTDLTLGAVLTERRYEAGQGLNRVGGVDLSWNPRAADRIDFQLLRSDSTALQAERGVPDAGGAALARWSHKGEAWNVDAKGIRIGRGFRADNGFIQEAGVFDSEVEVRRKQREIGPFNELSAYTLVQHKDAEDGPTLLRSARLGVGMGLPLETIAWVAPLMRTEQRAAVDTPLRTLTQAHLGLRSVPTRWLTQVDAEATVGELLDVIGDRVGRGHQLALQTKWRPLERVQVHYRIDDLAIRDAGVRLVAERAQQLLTLVHLSPDQHLRLILQSRRTQRETPPPWVPERQRDHAVSLTWQWRLDDDWVLDAGVSRGNFRLASPGWPSDWHSAEREAFVKLSWHLER